MIASSLFLGEVSGKNLLFNLSCARSLFHDEPGLKFTFEFFVSSYPEAESTWSFFVNSKLIKDKSIELPGRGSTVTVGEFP